MPNSVHSLDFSSTSSDGSYDSDDEEYRLAQQEWEESIAQLQQLVSFVLMPFFGKWLGRKWSYWGKKYLNVCAVYNSYPWLQHSLDM